MKSKLILLLSILPFMFPGNVNAQTYSKKKIKVYLLGTFHFAQTDEDYDVLASKHQESIQELCELIAAVHPNKIFVERQPEYEQQNKIDSLYKAHLTGEPIKWKNEIFQVGFRAGKMLNHPRIYQCDHPGQFGRHYRNSAKYARENNQEEILNAETIGTKLREYEINEDSFMRVVSLLDYMRWINTEEEMFFSHAGYVTIYPQIGSTDYYNYDDDNTLIGAELTADWYRRNIMTYSKIINQLDYSEEAIFLIMGADHIPIIRHLFESNPYFEYVQVSNWLSE